MIRRPALVAAALLALGIALHPWLPPYPIVWLFAAFFLTALAYRLHQLASQCCTCIALALVAGGIVCGQLASCWFATNHIGQFASDEPRLAAMEIELTDVPRLLAAQGPRRPSDQQKARATVRRIRTIHGWKRASGDVTFSLSQPDPPLSVGQTLRILGNLQRPGPAQNPGEFDWQRQYRRQRVLAEIRVSRSCDVQVLSGDSAAGAGLGQRVRQWLRAGFRPTQAADRELLVALVFGDRGPAVQQIEDDFNTTGTTHLLASSGLRIGMLTACLYLLCRLLRLPPMVSMLIVNLAALALGRVMLPSAQALRPVIACGAITLALLMRRTVDSRQFLGLAAIVLLILRPLDFYAPGFQLAFVVVLGMLLLTPPIAQRLEQKFRNPDTDVLEKIGRMTRRQRIWRWCWRRALQATVAGFVAWIVALPLVAYHFEQFNPWSVPVGLLLLPVTVTALVIGFAKIVLTAMLPFGSPLWAGVAGWPAATLRRGIALAARLPGADIPTPSPSITRVLLFYGLLMAACSIPLLPWGRMRVRLCAGCGLAGACVMSLFLPALVGFSGKNVVGGELRITLLAVGAGQCAAVESPDGRIFLLDAGSSTLADPLRSTLAPFLRHEGRSSVDGIFLSHGDFDHINAVAGLLEKFGIGEVAASPFLERPDESGTCRHLLAALRRTHHLPRLEVAGQHADLGGGASVDVLWPPAGCTMDSNNAGVVLKLHFGPRTVLFPADIQVPAETQLLKHPENLKADVLVAPHHGSSEATTADFVRAVDPTIIVSSNDRRLTTKQRTFEQIVAGRRLYRTSETGAITIVMDRNGNLRLEPFRSTRIAGITLSNP